MNILWCITGAGHFLEKCFDAARMLSVDNRITIAYSAAGYEVCRMYGFLDRIEEEFPDRILESDQGASAPLVGRLSRKEYDLVVVAPCTANTAAKIVHGIADSLVTNVVAQAGKCKVPVCILPTDARKLQKTRTPIYVDFAKCRRCDVCNAMANCPEEAFYVSDCARIDLMKCKGCKTCVDSCLHKAIEFGKEVDIVCRDLDVRNAESLAGIGGIKVIGDIRELF
jgi:dihydromethanopterin reductase (acceptor)